MNLKSYFILLCSFLIVLVEGTCDLLNSEIDENLTVCITKSMDDHEPAYSPALLNSRTRQNYMIIYRSHIRTLSFLPVDLIENATLNDLRFITDIIKFYGEEEDNFKAGFIRKCLTSSLSPHLYQYAAAIFTNMDEEKQTKISNHHMFMNVKRSFDNFDHCFLIAEIILNKPLDFYLIVERLDYQKKKLLFSYIFSNESLITKLRTIFRNTYEIHDLLVDCIFYDIIKKFDLNNLPSESTIVPFVHEAFNSVQLNDTEKAEIQEIAMEFLRNFETKRPEIIVKMKNIINAINLRLKNENNVETDQMPKLLDHSIIEYMKAAKNGKRFHLFKNLSNHSNENGKLPIENYENQFSKFYWYHQLRLGSSSILKLVYGDDSDYFYYLKRFYLLSSFVSDSNQIVATFKIRNFFGSLEFPKLIRVQIDFPRLEITKHFFSCFLENLQAESHEIFVEFLKAFSQMPTVKPFLQGIKCKHSNRAQFKLNPLNVFYHLTSPLFRSAYSSVADTSDSFEVSFEFAKFLLENKTIQLDLEKHALVPWFSFEVLVKLVKTVEISNSCKHYQHHCIYSDYEYVLKQLQNFTEIKRFETLCELKISTFFLNYNAYYDYNEFYLDFKIIFAYWAQQPDAHRMNELSSNEIKILLARDFPDIIIQE